MIQTRKSLLSFSLLILYLVFFSYGTLCLFDHNLGDSHPLETPQSSSPYPYHGSKNSGDLLHTCSMVQYLLSLSLVSGFFLFLLALSTDLWGFSYEEIFYGILLFSHTSRAPPF